MVVTYFLEEDLMPRNNSFSKWKTELAWIPDPLTLIASLEERQLSHHSPSNLLPILQKYFQVQLHHIISTASKVQTFVWASAVTAFLSTFILSHFPFVVSTATVIISSSLTMQGLLLHPHGLHRCCFPCLGSFPQSPLLLASLLSTSC